MKHCGFVYLFYFDAIGNLKSLFKQNDLVSDMIYPFGFSSIGNRL